MSNYTQDFLKHIKETAKVFHLDSYPETVECELPKGLSTFTEYLRFALDKANLSDSLTHAKFWVHVLDRMLNL